MIEATEIRLWLPMNWERACDKLDGREV